MNSLLLRIIESLMIIGFYCLFTYVMFYTYFIAKYHVTGWFLLTRRNYVFFFYLLMRFYWYIMRGTVRNSIDCSTDMKKRTQL